jgi:ATP-dependent DNA ligase
MVFSSSFIEPCLASKAVRPPSGPLWVHEIKHDGYRLMVAGMAAIEAGRRKSRRSRLVSDG